MANLVRVVSRGARISHRAIATSAVKQSSSDMTLAEKEEMFPRIGDRDVVGYGFNGTASYMDRAEFPFPAIRFGENTPEVMALREKEKGDWNNLTVADKKALYRASFCQTFAEFNAPSGEWRFITGGLFIALGISGAAIVWVKNHVYNPLPKTITREWRQAEMQRRVTEHMGAIDGATRGYFK